MDVEEALTFVEELFFENTKKLMNDRERAMFRGAWQGKTYKEIHKDCPGIGLDTLMRNVGPKLWKRLSEVLGAKVSINQLRGPVERSLTRPPNVSPTPSEAVPQHQQPDLEETTNAMPELPEGQVRLTSAFYVERPSIESRCYEAIKQPGALIRIKAPQQMGKTLLLNKILAQARTHNYQTETLSFELPDSTVFNDIHKFSQWFCASVGRLLGLPNKLADYWDDIFGCNDNTTAYFEEYLLAERTNPIILALDKVDRVFEHPVIANDFCCLLRGWYDMAKRSDRRGAIWKQLRLVVVHSTEVYSSLNLNYSPLAGVGVVIPLPDFNPEQVQELARHYGLDCLSKQGVEQLMAMVQGHPYLVQIALDHLKSQENTLEKLWQIAPTLTGPFSDHLRKHLRYLQQYPELAAAFREVVTTKNPVTLKPAQAFKLHSMGLIQIQGNDCSPRCNLYRQYFSVHLTTTLGESLQDQWLKTANN